MNRVFKKIIEFLLKWNARIYLWRIKPHTIIIAGTTNRFWVKEVVVDALKEKNFPVRTNKKNFNAEIGLPLSVLDLPSGEGNFFAWLKIIRDALTKAFRSKAPMLKEFLILEMAMDRPEGMNYLLSIVKPKTLILTTVTMIYAENFENLDEITLEYKRLIRALHWNGFAVLNFDDERIKKLADSTDKRIISYGFSKEADFVAKSVRKIPTGQQIEIDFNGEVRNVKINRFGKHHVYAALVKEIIRENFKISTPDFFKQMQK